MSEIGKDGWKTFSQSIDVSYYRAGLPGIVDRLVSFFTGHRATYVENIQIKFKYLSDAEPVDVVLSGLRIHRTRKGKDNV